MSAAIEGEVSCADNDVFPGFGFRVPTAIEGVDSALLDPQNGWENVADFKMNANELIGMFQKNFKRFSVAEHIAVAGPRTLD